ncbi:MAG: hypothetical protein ACOYXR_04510 [Nitrospirota bacterium]
MYAPWTRLLIAGLLAAFPLAAGAAESPTFPAAPQRLIVDTDSPPLVSVRDDVNLVEIVLIPSDDYRPVHPDSIEPDAEDGAADPDDSK